MRLSAVVAAFLCPVFMMSPILAQDAFAKDPVSQVIKGFKEEMKVILTPTMSGKEPYLHEYSPSPLKDRKDRLLKILKAVELYNIASPYPSEEIKNLPEADRKDIKDVQYVTLLALGMWEINSYNLKLDEYDADHEKFMVDRYQRNLLGKDPGQRPAPDPLVFMRARDYFLRAAILEPDRPEAYIGLSYLEAQEGNAGQSDYYEGQAGNLAGMKNIDLVALAGWKLERRANFPQAAVSYAKAGLEQQLPYFGDPYFLYKLSEIAPMARGPYNYWCRDVLSYLLFGNDTEIEPIRELLLVRLDRYLEKYLFAPRDPILDRVFFNIATAKLRRLIPLGLTPAVAPDFRLTALSTVFAKEQREPWLEIASKSVTRNEAGFLDACPLKEEGPDLVIRNDMLERWKRISKKVVHKFGSETDVKKKATDLAYWLRDPKNRILWKYDVFGGSSAKGMLAKNKKTDEYEGKYFCMTGSVAYMLLGRKIGVPVVGVTLPGHAFTVMDLDGRGYQMDSTWDPESYAREELAKAAEMPVGPGKESAIKKAREEIESSQVRKSICGDRALVCPFVKGLPVNALKYGRPPLKHSPEAFVAGNYLNALRSSFDQVFVSDEFRGKVKKILENQEDPQFSSKLLGKKGEFTFTVDELIDQWREYGPDQLAKIKYGKNPIDRKKLDAMPDGPEKEKQQKANEIVALINRVKMKLLADSDEVSKKYAETVLLGIDLAARGQRFAKNADFDLRYQAMVKEGLTPLKDALSKIEEDMKKERAKSGSPAHLLPTEAPKEGVSKTSPKRGQGRAKGAEKAATTAPGPKPDEEKKPAGKPKQENKQLAAELNAVRPLGGDLEQALKRRHSQLWNTFKSVCLAIYLSPVKTSNLPPKLREEYDGIMGGVRSIVDQNVDKAELIAARRKKQGKERVLSMEPFYKEDL